MFSKLLLTSSLGVLGVSASPLRDGAQTNPVVPRQNGTDNTQPVGENPITTFDAQFLGYQKAENSCSHRDLGFVGQLQGSWYSVWGDTLWCDAGVSDPDQDTDGFHGMVRDALSRMTDDALVVEDLNLNTDSPVAHQNQLVPYNEAWGETNTYGFGGTSIAEASDGMGIVYILVNANQPGVESTILGAGAAKIEVVNGNPVVTERLGDNGQWWDTSKYPRYGDVATFRDTNSDYIYIWGGAPTMYDDDYTLSGYVYLCRVDAADAFDLTRYEYYWGPDQGWKSDVLTQHDSSTAVWWNSGQGQVVWNEKFQCYVFVRVGPGSADVYLRTATSLEGPWTPDVKVYTTTPIDGGLVYAGVAHPYLDDSGETLTVSWTNNNQHEVLKLTF